MLKIWLMLPLWSSLLLVGCATTGDKDSKVDQEYLEAAVVWYQNAAEMRALSYQAYNVAKTRLAEDLKKSSKKPRAVILDIDETVLDNSPYQARNILLEQGYPTDWALWIERAEAKPLPGVKEFLDFAHKNGVEIFYVTNRKIKGFDATLKNLQALKLPVKKENLLLRTDTSAKGPRREKVEENYRVVLLIGDNMGDFHDAYDKASVEERLKITTEFQQKFGDRYIVLPNPMYGDWEQSLYHYNYKKTQAQKREDRKRALRANSF